jgi:hypothetical protein
MVGHIRGFGSSESYFSLVYRAILLVKSWMEGNTCLCTDFGRVLCWCCIGGYFYLRLFMFSRFNALFLSISLL